MELDQAIISGVIGLITGGIGSLIAPWMNWGIEKKRLRYGRRVIIINELKLIASEKEFDRIKFINSSNYRLVRNYFSSETIKDIERPLNHIIAIIGNPAIDVLRSKVLEDIARIEKIWGII